MLTHEKKLLYPKEAISKKEVYEYYEKASSFILPHMKDRPLTLQRAPNGIDQEIFFQKNASDYFPKWLKTEKIKNLTGGFTQGIFCQNKRSLLFLANQNTLSFHGWMSRIDKINYPDKILFDIDPPKEKVEMAREAVFFVKEELDRLSLKSFLLTTGSKGYHIVIPIKRLYTFEETKIFAEKILQNLLEKTELFTREVAHEKRKEKIYLDILRNAYGQISVIPYSLRTLPDATIAMPISWKAFEKDIPSNFMHLRAFSLKKDPWEDYFSLHQKLPLS